MKKRIASFLLALCMLLTMAPMPGHVHAVEAENVQSHDTGTDTAAVYAEGTIDLSQYSAGDTIIISNDSIIYGDGILHDVTVHITEDAIVTFDVGTGGVQLLDSITVADGKTLTLLVAGDAEHTVNGGISLGNGSNVIIEGDLTKENNKLTVTATDGNAGIGANGGVTAGDITIRNARVDATGSSKEVSADSNKGIKADTSISGAAIGTSDGSMGNILIENSIIVAEGGYYEDTSHAPAIGIGYVGSTMGNITLKDSQITARNNGDGLASVIGAGANKYVYLTGTLGDIVITNTELNLSMEIGTTNYYAALIGSGGGKSYAYVNMGKIIFTDMKQEELDEVIPTWLPSDFNQYGAYALGIGYEGNVYKCGTFGGVWVSDGNGGTVQIGDESGYYIACKNGGFVHDFDEICGGTCSDCGVTYLVVHTMGTAATCSAKAVCSVCGESYGELGGHTPNAAGYTDNGDGTHSYTCTVCGPVTEDHTGGTATSCTTRANCEHCGASYGEVDTTNHDSTVAFDSNGFCPNGCYEPATDSNADGVYEIGSTGQLYWFAEQINSGALARNTGAILTADINLENREWATICPTGLYYDTTTYSDTGYTGTFDGQGHTVSNYTVKGISGTKCSVGLFGTLSGTVKNLGVTNMTFQLNGATDVRAAAIAGQMLPGSHVTDCYVTDSTLAPKNYIAGGIAACNYGGTISNCFTYRVTVEANSRCGNLVSDCRGDIGESDRSGNVVNCWTDAARVTGTQVPSGLFVLDCYANAAGALASGEAAWNLNSSSSDGIWKQNLGTDATPNFTGGTVYQVGVTCTEGAVAYSNTQGDLTHHYKNGICTVCGVYEPATDSNADGVYEIGNAGQLYWFMEKVNAGETTINGKLTNHIVVNEGTMTADSTDARVWTPIGYANNYYAGTFDGCGFTVSGLYFNNSGTTDVGLFGSVSGGTVKNVGVLDSYLSGKYYVGGVVGYIDNGTVEGCYNSGTVSGIAAVGGVVGWANTYNTVTNCYNTGNVSGSGDYVGGVVGNIEKGTVERCYNTGTVSGSGNYVGGVAGYFEISNMTNCYNTGNVSGGNYVGGVAGNNEGDSFTALSDVMGCYNSGTVSGSGNYVGSVVGYKNSYGFVTNCYYLADSETDSIDDTTFKTADQFERGEVAYLLNGDQSTIVFKQTIGTDAAPNFTGGTVYQVTNCKNETVYSNTNENIDHNWVGGTCTVCEEVCGHTGGKATCTTLAVCTVCGEIYGEVDKTNHDETVAYENGFCPVCDDYEPAADSDSDGYYEIDNAGQLYWFAAQVNSGNTAINGELTADIVVNEGTMTAETTGARAWTPIGNKSRPYIGTFDGGEYTISGLYFNDRSTDYVGLFGRVGSGGTVQNVSITDSYICGRHVVGGVAGYNNGTVTDCHNTGTVSGTNYVGGVAGDNYGTLTSCSNTGDVSGSGYVGGVVGNNNSDCTVSNCYNTGTVRGYAYVGGVAGYNFGTVTNSYNTGDVSGYTNVGGVASENFSGGTVTNCYFDSTVYTGNAIGTNGGTATDVEGKSTAQFASGEVAYLLSQGENGSIWGQTIGTDDAPNFTGGTVYQVTNCKNEIAYSNTNENIGHNYVNGKCTVCEAGDPNWNSDVGVVFINEKTTIPHTVNGRTVTVDYELPCSAGYWDEAQQSYVAIPAVEDEDGGYRFTAPVGVEEVLLVITGDTNGDGRVTASDIARLNAYLKNKTDLTAKELFAADVNHDGRLDDADKSAMSAAVLGIASLQW